MTRFQTFNVAPRWSGGSPASVDFATADRVAKDERNGHAAALEGFYGEADQRRAAELPYALRGIVERRVEYPDGWLVVDLLTNEVGYRFAARRDGKPPTRAQHDRARGRIFLERESLRFRGLVEIAEEVRQ